MEEKTMPINSSKTHYALNPRFKHLKPIEKEALRHQARTVYSSIDNPKLTPYKHMNRFINRMLEDPESKTWVKRTTDEYQSPGRGRQ